MNLIELFYFQKEYEKVIVWYDKTLRVLDNKSSPLLNFKYYVSLIKLAEKSKELPGHKAKAFMDYTMMDDNPFYYYALAIKHHDAGNKEEFFAQIQSAAYIFNDLYLIKNWNKALQDASYLEASEIILRDLEKEE